MNIKTNFGDIFDNKLPIITAGSVALAHVTVQKRGIKNDVRRLEVVSVPQVRLISVSDITRPYGTMRTIIQTKHQL